MVNSAKIRKITLFTELLLCPDNKIIAYRKQKPLFLEDLKLQVSYLIKKIETYSKTRWAIYCQDSFYFLASLLALLYCKKEPILITNHKSYYLSQLNDQFDLLLTDSNPENFLLQKPLINIQSINDEINCNKLISTKNLFKTALDDELTITLFTSGSTGLPKPIKKTLWQLQKESQILADYFFEKPHQELKQPHLFIASVAHHHQYGLIFKIILALALQQPFICEQIYYQEQIFLYQALSLPFIFISSPSLLKSLDTHLSKIICKMIFSAGGTISTEIVKVTELCLGKIPFEIYGSSETGIIAVRQSDMREYVWKLFPQIRLTTKNRQILLSSPLLNRTVEPINDKIETIDSQYFYLLGRNDRIIKIAEQRISLTFIEQQLSSLPQLSQFVIFPLEDKKRTIIVTVAVLTKRGIIQINQMGKSKFNQYLQQQLRSKIPLIAIPKRWRFVDTIPCDSQGKHSMIDIMALFN